VPQGRPKALAPWGERREATLGGIIVPQGRPKALASRGERREATLGGIIVPQGRPKALAPWGERREATLGRITQSPGKFAFHQYRLVSVMMSPSRVMFMRLRKLMPSSGASRPLPSSTTASTS